MNTESQNPIVGWAWKIPAIAIAYFIGVMISGAIITAAKMQWPTFPGSASETENFILGFISSFFMAACLTLLARGIRGSLAVRWLILAIFLRRHHDNAPVLHSAVRIWCGRSRPLVPTRPGGSIVRERDHQPTGIAVVVARYHRVARVPSDLHLLWNARRTVRGAGL
jgi:uncharacterized membrane protein